MALTADAQVMSTKQEGLGVVFLSVVKRNALLYVLQGRAEFSKLKKGRPLGVMRLEDKSSILLALGEVEKFLR